jgi:molybdopterin-guanine dinucleotide biosynthesis protein B
MVPVISFVGYSKSGKTTLLEKVVPELKKLGYRVAFIKHTHHNNFDIDLPGKDTWRLSQAGSDVMVISSAEKLAIIEKVSEELYLDRILELIADKVDVILTEGYKQADTIKVEVSNDKENDLAEIVEFIVNHIQKSHIT